MDQIHFSLKRIPTNHDLVILKVGRRKIICYIQLEKEDDVGYSFFEKTIHVKNGKPKAKAKAKGKSKSKWKACGRCLTRL
jgi:hypothetical protein